MSESTINQVILAIKRNGVGIKGNIETDHNNPVSISVNNTIRYILYQILQDINF